MPYGRSLSRGRRGSSYPTGEGMLVDASTKQLLLSEVDANKMGRTILRGNELFTEGTANAILERHLRKKKSSGTLNFLVDRIRYKRRTGTTRGECILYREIKHFYRFPSHPNAFMLCVEQEHTGKRSYETYTCRDASDVNSAQRLVSQARADPHCLLHNPEQNGRGASTSESDGSYSRYNGRVHGNGITKTVFSSYETPFITQRQSRWDVLQPVVQSPLLIERTRSVSSLQIYDPESSPEIPNNISYIQRVVPVRTEPSANAFSHTLVEEVRSPSPTVPMPVPLEHRDWIIQLPSGEYREAKLINPPPRTKFIRPSWNDDVTFISKTNSGREPQVTDTGPVYMYVARTQRPSITPPQAPEPKLRKKKTR
ncbi:hypothetical protein CSKR_104508 [Clonorchis sinensis]|uniref:Uncharacterized protein n=2 Tax=Clonorchis sinensis TaxID=79923 RepID=H2KUV0_CLOSI|nr:hypothetical protein CSKR_104508 [Clonorchis sinensis]GAA35032.1 hypothetical protein CLF_110441 [Clonorchis sinensis]